MSITLGIRDLVRNSKVLEEYPFVDIEDKKTHQYKGVFISAKYAKKIKELIQKEIKSEKKRKIDELMQFAGVFDSEFQENGIQELKAKKRDKYLDE
jgi:hypothetical protein